MKKFKYVITWSNGDRAIVYHALPELQSVDRFKEVHDEEMYPFKINFDHIRSIESRGLYQVTNGKWEKVEI